MKKPTKNVTPQQSHPYGTRSKTKVNSIVLESSLEDERNFGVVENLFNCLSTNFQW